MYSGSLHNAVVVVYCKSKFFSLHSKNFSFVLAQVMGSSTIAVAVVAVPVVAVAALDAALTNLPAFILFGQLLFMTENISHNRQTIFP